MEAAGAPMPLAETAAAIALRETAGPGGTMIDTAKHNEDAATGDDSYGPFQINFRSPQIGALMAANGIADPTALYDPATSARAFMLIYRSDPRRALSQAWYIDHGGAYQAQYEAHLVAVHTLVLASLATPPAVIS